MSLYVFVTHTHTHTHTPPLSVSQGGERERVDPEGADPDGHAAQRSAFWGKADLAER